MWKVRIVRRMIELFPFESREEMLRQQSVSGHCYESTHAGKHTTSLILDRTTQFLKRFAIIDTCVNCRASRSTIKARSLQVKSLFCPKTLCIWYFSREKSLLEFFLYCLLSMDCFDSRIACDIWNIPSDNTTQEVVALFFVSRQKGQRTVLLFHFIFCRKHLWHPACTQYTYISDNFVKKWNVWKMQRKRRNDKSILSNFLFNCMHQIVNRRWSSAPFIVVHIFASFIEKSYSSPLNYLLHVLYIFHKFDGEFQQH